MKVYIERPKTEKNLEFEGTLKKLLSLLKVNPETVIVAKGQELITEEEILKNTDEIRIMSVISGGWIVLNVLKEQYCSIHNYARNILLLILKEKYLKRLRRRILLEK